MLVRCECRYECDKCEWKIHLTNHIKSKHEGVRYECDQCEYKTTLQSYLIYNKQSKHEEVRYACDIPKLIFDPQKYNFWPTKNSNWLFMSSF